MKKTYFSNMGVSDNSIIDTKYLPALSRIFSPIVLNDLAQNGRSDYLNEVCLNSGILNKLDNSMPLSGFFDWIYGILLKSYRNEYVYKNAITNKILLGKHSLNTSQMLTEFRVGKCKADAVVLNRTSTVYEIKSEFDSFSRLSNQIKEYSQIFDHINVITSGSQAKKLRGELPENIGLLVLTARNQISTVRDSVSNKANISQSVLFDSLRKNEYLQIISVYYGYIPDVPNTRIFKECKKLFCNIPPEEAHDSTMSVLKKRNATRTIKDFLATAPDSLSAYALSMAESTIKIKALMGKLSLPIGAVLTPETA